MFSRGRAKIASAGTLTLVFSLLGVIPAQASVFNCDGGGSYTVSSGVVTTNSSCSGALEFDASVTSIGNQAFQNNSSLTSVVFPATVTSIGNDAFKSTKINSVTFNEGLTSIGSFAFADIAPSTGTRLSAVFPNSLTSLGDQAFAQSRLGHFVFGTGLTNIPSHSFYNNFGFGALSVTLTGSVTSLSTAAFVGLRQEYLYLPDSITAIGERVFEISALKIVRLPENLSSLHSTAFGSSGSIQKVVYCGNLAGVSSTEGISGKPLVCGNVAEFKSNIPGEFSETYLQVASSSETLETPSFNRNGYEITSWNLQENGLGTAYPAGSSFPFASDTILYASWSVVVYTVSFNSSGGSSQTSLSYTLGSSPLSLPTTSRTGYEFLGWTDPAQPSSLLSGSFTPTSDLTLTASWSEVAQVAAENPVSFANVPLPIITSYSNKQVLPGQDVTVSGRRLDQVFSATLGGFPAEISLQSESGFTLRTADLLPPGIYDLVLETVSGRMTFMSALTVSQPMGLVSFTLRSASHSLSENQLEELAMISGMFATGLQKVHCLVNGADARQAAEVSTQVCDTLLRNDRPSVTAMQTVKSSFKGNGFWIRVYLVG
jgi:uncharacterized repeat protein (TIGR02543 family)